MCHVFNFEEMVKICLSPFSVISAVLDQAQYNRAQKSVPATYWTPMASLITPIITAKANGTNVSDSMLKGYLDALCRQIRK